MRVHPDHARVQSAGCGALGNLAAKHPNNQTAVVAAGGLEAVVTAMRASAGAELVQRKGCYALRHLMTLLLYSRFIG